ncbi:PIPO, partial [Cyrtanthus elatus virus A]|uniref:PIPO n=1 Tax=Cyrtanthus elatus virus A TaxID=861561 RepID=UPI0002656E3B
RRFVCANLRRSIVRFRVAKQIAVIYLSIKAIKAFTFTNRKSKKKRFARRMETVYTRTFGGHKVYC